MATTTTSGQKQKPEIIPRKRVSIFDIAKSDGKYKELIRMQEIAQAGWKEKWGFMKHEEVEKIYKDEAKARGLPEDFVEKRRLRFHRKTAETPFLKLKPSNSVPILSSGFNGWRSSDPGCTLEIVGPLYISPLQTIDPPPLEREIDLKSQRYIILG